MSNICLPPKVSEKFTRALISGKINPSELVAMTSEERRALFTEVVGEGNAKFVNSNFESKMILKNQERGIITWAKNLTGITPETRRDLITRVGRLEKVLNPEDEKAFLSDLASTKLGLDVTAKEAKQLTKMSKALQDFEAKKKPDGTFDSKETRMQYGHARVDMGDYLDGLKKSAAKETIPEQLKRPDKLLSKAAGISKSLKASLDDSAIFRQGWKTLWTNPGLWQKNARKTFGDIVRTVGGRQVMRETMADIASRPNYDKYQKMKLAVGNIEEEIPSSLPEKIPLAGRLFKASTNAYEGFLYRQRADVADKYLQIAERGGVDINDRKQLEAIGKVINSLTGRGHLGRFENGQAAQTLNNVFFSVRFFKSNIDTLTGHSMQHGMTKFARKRAALNLLEIAGGTAAVLATANALKPGSVEWDPRSSDFGKIRLGNTRFDVSGGMAGFITLASQIATQEQKSASTGVVKKLGETPIDDTGLDKFFNFFSNKFSPAAVLVRDLIRQENFKGDKPTPGSAARDLLVPIPITTPIEASKDPEGANPLLAYIADSLGIGANTYGMTDRSTDKLSKTQQAFKDKIGDEQFELANESFERDYDKWYAEHKKDIADLPNEDKQSVITSAKNKIQKGIYGDFHFKPPKATKATTERRKKILETIH